MHLRCFYLATCNSSELSYQLLTIGAFKSTMKRSESEVWIEDDEAPNCFVCKEEFGFFLRRHHCRRCGNVVCYKHSESQMVIPRLDPTALQQVISRDNFLLGMYLTICKLLIVNNELSLCFLS